MIKTLRITTFIAAILAVGFFAFPVVFGYRGDEQIEKFLKLPGAIEKFNKAKGAEPLKAGDQVSPLVKEATAFALYLNPPRKETPKLTKIPTVRKQTPVIDIPAPPRSSAKFTLIGTSFFKSRPEMSLAYIDEPGKGLYWVRQGSNVGHLVIEQVQDGSVIVKDNEKSVTLVAARTPRRSLIKGETTSQDTPSSPSSSIGITSAAPVQVSTEKSVTSALDKRSAVTAKSKKQAASAEEMAMMEKLMLELSAIQDDTKAGEADSHRSAERSEALLDKYISDLEAMRVTTGEAKRLDLLGEELRRGQRDPNLAEDSKVQRSGPPISRPPRRTSPRRQPPKPPR